MNRSVTTITKEEAKNLTRFIMSNEITIAKDLWEIWKNKMHEDKEKDVLWAFWCALAFIYDVGRVQGIRDERARRKGAKK